MMQTIPKTTDCSTGEEYDPAIAALRDAAGMAGALARKLERACHEAAIEQAVNRAVAEGKIAPELRGAYVAFCNQEGGFAGSAP
jgi:hypothetical protein